MRQVPALRGDVTALLVLFLSTGDGIANIEIRVGYATLAECQADLPRVSKQTGRYASWFGAKLVSSECKA